MRICRAGKHWFLAYQCAGSKERKSGRESLNYPFEQKWQEEKLPSCGSAGVKATPKAAPECLADKRLCECGVCVCAQLPSSLNQYLRFELCPNLPPT